MRKKIKLLEEENCDMRKRMLLLEEKKMLPEKKREGGSFGFGGDRYTPASVEYQPAVICSIKRTCHFGNLGIVYEF
ncbi:hypothetical protein AT2G19290 [Arabidopsis thaliana]|uniref:Uncharacterized protein At2g19290 n=1 Tax=Arabidopsis thaliana TaxID=3702 RepID=O64562_ARATH|nr:uncharacterized protein AT2G19290 [Arabidopsis thaliana]AAC16459.1 hypothetical protein [Arabidopsis thaliana]AEC06865.1 hypothetical protein AT2G19290 [Arabidopsis thaliana]|eukprot:NP_179519.1 hypothetical protein AT2G19290 [Arabidopsis thaliana]